MSAALRESSPSLSNDTLLRLFRELVRTRAFDEAALLLQRTGRIPAYYSCAGQEAHVAVSLSLNDRDWVFTQYREQGLRLARGVTVQEELALWYGLADATWNPVRLRITPLCPTIGSALPHATGFGYASRLLHKDEVAVAIFGDGATSEGDFHAALNAAGVWKTPTVFFCQNNQYAQSTPLAEQTAARTLADKAIAYGIPGERIDGMDAVAVFEAMQRALTRARNGAGPTLIESMCYRYGAHSTYDGVPIYRTREEEAEWRGRDVLDRMRALLDSRGLLPAGLEQQIKGQMQTQVLEAIDALEALAISSRVRSVLSNSVRVPQRLLDQLHRTQGSLDEPLTEIGSSDMFKVGQDSIPMPGVGSPEVDGASKALTLSEALNLALRDAMERDRKLIVLGEDVGREGGIFRVTAGLFERFGRQRVLDTPLSEVCIAGSAVGMAIAGARCACEIEFAGFSYSAFDQIIFHIARYRWRTGGRINMPIVVRMPVGGGHAGLEGHSDSPEALYSHAPGGLVIVYPSNPFDAKGLLAAALQSDDPVIFFEPVGRYFERQGPVPLHHYTLPIGRARIVTAGNDITCVTYGNTVSVAAEAAMQLAAEGISVEVIDLRTLKPWDESTVLGSVSRTGRLLVIHEAPISGGPGAEIVATVCEQVGHRLRASPMRLGHPDLIWAPGKLEPHSMLQSGQVAGAARSLVQRSASNAT